MITQPEVLPYLSFHGLVSAQSVVEGDFQVVDASRRNSSFAVTSEHGPCYLLKQGVGPERTATVIQEAAVYKLLASLTSNHALNRFLPRVSLYAQEECILVMEFLRDSENVWEHHRRIGRFPVCIGEAIGVTLSALHVTTLPNADERNGHIKLPMQPPWTLAFHRPSRDLFNDLSSANLQLIRIIQQFPEFCRLLDELRGAWKAVNLVHGDIRWTNIVVPKQSRGHISMMKLVDWETAQVGDPCWDVGSVFNDYLSFWLLSIPITGEDPPDRYLEMARYPLAKMQPAIRAFWGAYVKRMKLDSPTAEEWLIRSVRYCAARLVQTAYEEGQMGQQVTGNAVCMLQLAYNILLRPQEAALHLLGIPVLGAWRV